MTAAARETPLPGPPTLGCMRVSAAEWAARAASAVPPIGGLSWELAAPGLAAPVVPMLWPSDPCVDAWLGAAPLRSGRTGGVHWQDDGHWVFGHVDVAADDADLTGAAYRAYADVFAALRACGQRQLLRVWNYLPRINADGGGLERYRQFNIGRQQAFIEAGCDRFESAPAASAVGTRGSELGVRFLAGRAAPRALENPRQVPAYRYSPTHGPRSPSFSRATLVEAGMGRLALFVSGTASIVGEKSVHAGDVRAQMRETLLNLQAVLAAARAHSTAAFTLADLSCAVYVRHAADSAAIREVFEADFGVSSGAVFLQADICRSELLVEVEGHAFAAGELKSNS